MKPIHHALVSARLFGGAPEDYVALHTAFDCSKGALPDMRHRAALHSIDHGAQVMQMVFPDAFPGASLADLCTQHVHDDQGFGVRLDDWLVECDLPQFAAVRRRPPADLAGFLEDPVAACVARWGGCPEDYAAICAYYAIPETVSDHPLAPAVALNAFGIMFSEQAFGPAIVVTGRSGRPKYVAVRDIGECMTLARWGRIPTLGDVFAGMKKRDWMLGSKVARSRRRRCREAGRDDLFSEGTDGVEKFDTDRSDGIFIARDLLD